MCVSRLRGLLFAIPLVSVLAQTPSLQMNVVYVCTDGQSFKVFSCTGAENNAAVWLDECQGHASQRHELLRACRQRRRCLEALSF